jgi:hypothetical protein
MAIKMILPIFLGSGGEATSRSYADEEFKDPTFVTYRRTPTDVARTLHPCDPIRSPQTGGCGLLTNPLHSGIA